MIFTRVFITGIVLSVFIANMPVRSQSLTLESKKHRVQKPAFAGRPSPHWFVGAGAGFGWTTDNVRDYLNGTGWNYELRALYVNDKRVDLRGLIGFHLFRHSYTLNKSTLSSQFNALPDEIQLQPGRTDLTGLMLSIGGAAGLDRLPNVNHFFSFALGLGVYHHRRQGAVVTGRDEPTRVPPLNETRFALAFKTGYLTDLSPSLRFYLDGRLHMVFRAFDPGEGGVGAINLGLVAGFLVGL